LAADGTGRTTEDLPLLRSLRIAGVNQISSNVVNKTTDNLMHHHVEIGKHDANDARHGRAHPAGSRDLAVSGTGA
jgi:hypothetical protein